MIGFEQEKRLPVIDEFRRHARRLQLWRLCCHAACRRTHCCRGDPKHCGTRLADWAEAVRTAAQQELNASDPSRQGPIEELKEKIVRMHRTMMDQP